MSNTVDAMINFDLGDSTKRLNTAGRPKLFDFQKSFIEKIAANCNISVALLRGPMLSSSQTLSALYVERMRRDATIAAKAGAALQEKLFKHYLIKRRPDLYGIAYGFQAQNRELRGRTSIKINRRRTRLIHKTRRY